MSGNLRVWLLGIDRGAFLLLLTLEVTGGFIKMTSKIRQYEKPPLLATLV